MEKESLHSPPQAKKPALFENVVPAKQAQQPLLTATQAHVLKRAQRRAKARSRAARAKVLKRLRTLGLSRSAIADFFSYFREQAPIVIAFNPTQRLPPRRPSPKGVLVPEKGKRQPRTVVEALTLDGRVRNQFETGTSGAELSAHAGGIRVRYERELFCDDYGGAPIVATERPKYGALLFPGVKGKLSSRHGDCFLFLKPQVRARTTVTPFDSSRCVGKHLGTFESFHHVIDACSSSRLHKLLKSFGAKPTHRRRSALRPWDYFEAQIHGSVELSRDVAKLEAPLDLKQTSTGHQLQRMAKKYGFPVEWR